MTTELLEYREGGQTFEALIERPTGAGPHPAIMICHAWGGRDAFVEDKARRLAALGYIGVAIDLYGVGKRGTDVASSQALMMPLVNDPPLLRRRLEASFEVVRGLAGVDHARLGTMGYCFGGMCSILSARMGLDQRGAVSFHGLLKIGEPLATKPKARILVLHGQDDPMAPPADLGAFAAEMKRVDATWSLESYAGVQHAFTNPAAQGGASGMLYDETADRRSWLAMTRFFGDLFG